MVAHRSVLIAALLIGTTTSSSAHAAPPKPAPRVEHAHPGALEFGLAGVLMGVGIGLIGFGSVELVRTREHQRSCSAGSSGSGIDPCVFDPPALGYAAVGLSWGFSIPILIGSGLLFARGARARAEARRQPRPIVAPWWWDRRSGGVSLRFRF